MRQVAEIKSKQAINEENGQYKVDKLAAKEKLVAEAAAKKAARAVEVKAAQAKYANKR